MFSPFKTNLEKVADWMPDRIRFEPMVGLGGRKVADCGQKLPICVGAPGAEKVKLSVNGHDSLARIIRSFFRYFRSRGAQHSPNRGLVRAITEEFLQFRKRYSLR
jgi:hypothetical protein